jgi:bacteriocin-like protein
MDKEKFKDRDNQKDKQIQDKEIEKLTDEELEKVSGGPILPMLEDMFGFEQIKI